MASSSCEFLVKKKRVSGETEKRIFFLSHHDNGFLPVDSAATPKNEWDYWIPRVVVSVVCLALSLAAPLQGSDTLLTHSSGVSATASSSLLVVGQVCHFKMQQ